MADAASNELVAGWPMPRHTNTDARVCWVWRLNRVPRASLLTHLQDRYIETEGTVGIVSEGSLDYLDCLSMNEQRRCLLNANPTCCLLVVVTCYS